MAMKKYLIFIFLYSVITTNHFGQVFNIRDLDLNLGAGAGFNLYSGNFIVGIPPLSASIDYGLNDSYGPGVIGIGGFAGYSTFKDSYFPGISESGHKYSALFIGLKSSYHLELIKKLDTYATLNLYYVNLTAKPYGAIETEKDIKSKPNLSLVVGSKYFFTDKLALFAEVGYNSSWLTAGVSFRL
jgi:hypothetical protein